MSRVLTFCWREWRAQRGILLAYALVALGSLCIVLLLVPSEWWREEGQGALALSWFLAVGAAGVLAFVAPNLVRSEFTAAGDRFVRRLPGALLPSFLGKGLFLLLCAAALPLTSLLVGQGFLLAIGQSWRDLFEWRYDGEVLWRLPQWLPALGYAALLLPWVWALGTWLPKGRMALGGTIVFVLLLALGVFAVLRQSPQIEHGIAWRNWLWAVPALGIGVASVSWTLGRRGGGALRSARCGLTATALGLLPPAWWLGARVVDYHCPDLQRLVTLGVSGLSPDGRYVLAYGAADHAFFNVPLRIDLHDGSAVQLGGIGSWFAPSWHRPWQYTGSVRRRWWPFMATAADDHRLRAGFDLEQLRVVEVPWSETRDEPLDPAGLHGLIADELRRATRLRAPGDRRVFWLGRDLCFEGDGGAIERMPWPGESPVMAYPAGHGMRVSGSTFQWFEFATRRLLAEAPGTSSTLFVRGAIVFRRQAGARQPATWWRRLPGGADERIDGLDDCFVLGLVDDDRLLVVRQAKPARLPSQLLLWHVHEGTITDIDVPECLRGCLWNVVPEGAYGSVLARDPGGRLGLCARTQGAGDALVSFALLDVDAGRFTTVYAAGRQNWNQVVDWLGPGVLLLARGGGLERLDLSTGARDVLFPRPAR